MIDLRNCDLIFNGELLSDTATFDTYGIRSKDAIVAIPSNSETLEARRWLTITRDSDAFHEKIRFLLNENTAHESARIHDVVMNKIERRPRAFRRLCSTVDSIWSQHPSECSIASNVGYSPASAPSSAPLPFSWNPANMNEAACCIPAGPATVDVKPDQPASICPPIHPSNQ
jgi:hypothetical protein